MSGFERSSHGDSRNPYRNGRREHNFRADRAGTASNQHLVNEVDLNSDTHPVPVEARDRFARQNSGFEQHHRSPNTNYNDNLGHAGPSAIRESSRSAPFPREPAPIGNHAFTDHRVCNMSEPPGIAYPPTQYSSATYTGHNTPENSHDPLTAPEPARTEYWQDPRLVSASYQYDSHHRDASFNQASMGVQGPDQAYYSSAQPCMKTDEYSATAYSNGFHPQQIDGYSMYYDSLADNDYDTGWNANAHQLDEPFPIYGDDYQINTYEVLDDQTTISTGTRNQHSASTLSPLDSSDARLGPQGSEATEKNDLEYFEGPHDGLHRRRTHKARLQMFRGNLVVDCKVSQRFLSSLPNIGEQKSSREFSYMRYSSITCDPADFSAENFSLRQTVYSTPRQTEIFVAVTMYNEDDILLGRTLLGVFRNIKHLCNKKRSKTWGTEGWKKIVVCVIADGRKKVNPRAVALMSALGCYQDGFAKNKVGDKDVEAHLFEYTSLKGIEKVGKRVHLSPPGTATSPVQLVFCLKEKNKKKINSHRWFFQALAPVCKPKVCILLDAGTQPSYDSFYNLWKEFDRHPNVAGACGEIRAALGKGGRYLLNPLVAAQNFEYKMSNILDKPVESVFGLISVLPGAFSAYRYEALQNDSDGQGPLKEYFKGETLHDVGAGVFTMNMYLAEDRILCFELAAKRHSRWVLKYVKSASAHTDVPDKLPEFIGQRRRWLNGSFFAAIYAQTHFMRIWSSGHSFGRKLALQFESLYQLISLLYSWFGVSNFFLVFRILTQSLGSDGLGFAPGKILATVLLWVYCACLVTVFVISFGNRPKGSASIYYIMVIFYALLMGYLGFAAVFLSAKSIQQVLCENGNRLTIAVVVANPIFLNVVISMLSTYALYLISSILYLDPWHVITSMIQYMLLSPTYINILNVYAFCNIHDISWGTKGDDKSHVDLGIAKPSSKGDAVEVAIPTQMDEIDLQYSQQMARISSAPPKEVTNEFTVSEKTQDSYAMFRSSVVLAWMLTNFMLVAVVLNTAGLKTLGSDPTQPEHNQSGLYARQNHACPIISVNANSRTQIYLAVILWSVSGLALIRFIGCVTYLCQRVFRR